MSSVRILQHEGQSLTISEWAKKIGIADGAIRQRLRNGWEIEDALSRSLRVKSHWNGDQRFCTICKTYKSQNEFSRRGSGTSGWCKKCAGKKIRVPRNRFSMARSSAKKSGHSFDLSFDQWFELVKKSCIYCGGRLPDAGSGLDRKDNAREYTIDNVVPCCTICNKTKSNVFTYEEMLLLGAVVSKIKEARKL